MKSNRYTLLIHSCDKFSDLWDAHVKLLNKNWLDRNCRTCILTDASNPQQFDGVEVMSAGAGMEITERIRYALTQITTNYVLVTLDDYFVTTPISSARIERLIDIMEAKGYDYVRLFDRPRGGLTPTEEKDFFDLSLKGDYKVNLYPGIWRTDFMAKTLGDKVLNAWEFEVTLTDNARAANGKCAVSLGCEFPILDVVRKGKILPKAAHYLRRHNLYHGNRPRMSRISYMKLGIKTQSNRVLSKLPSPLYMWIKRFCNMLGMHSFSVKK